MPERRGVDNPGAQGRRGRAESSVRGSPSCCPCLWCAGRCRLSRWWCGRTPP